MSRILVIALAAALVAVASAGTYDCSGADAAVNSVLQRDSTILTLAGVSSKVKISDCHTLKSLTVSWGASSALDFDFANLETVLGNVVIEGAAGAIKKLEFSKLTTVGGNVNIVAKTNDVTKVVFVSLASVGGNFIVGSSGNNRNVGAVEVDGVE